MEDIPRHEHDYSLPEYTFRNGQKIRDLKTHYVTLGTPERDSEGSISNAVLMLHWTGGSSANLLTEDFYQELYEAGKPLDATRYFLIFPDSIGHGKSSKPSDGLRADFPNYGYQDMVDIQYLLVTKQLRIAHLKLVLGTSMGGMHTWLWAVNYPEFMDGAMPIVSLPTRVDGRNLLWRQIVVRAIKNDPEWKNGRYDKQPVSLSSTWPLARMLLDGVPHLKKIVPDTQADLTFIKEAEEHTKSMDANNLIYALEASKDYAPENDLGSIRAKIYALDFSDDQLDPIQLHTLETLIKRVKQGKAVIQPGTPDSYGHLTMAHPSLWSLHVTEFIQFVKKNP